LFLAIFPVRTKHLPSDFFGQISELLILLEK